MRGIVFRGKRVGGGDWMEWTLVEALVANPINIEVELKTVGAFSGLCDRNGKKIFEGDYIGSGHNVVEYHDGAFTINGDRPLSSLKGTKNFVVVGNIHDNPELLERRSNDGT